MPELRHGAMIVNTQPHNLPGQHWIAIYITNTTVKVFDPLGQVYPSFLVNEILKTRKHVTFNRVMYQNPLSTTCAQHCIAWLHKQMKTENQ